MAAICHTKKASAPKALLTECQLLTWATSKAAGRKAQHQQNSRLIMASSGAIPQVQRLRSAATWP